MTDSTRLSADDATPIDGPYRRSFIDSPVFSLIAAVLLVAACGAIVVAFLPAP